MKTKFSKTTSKPHDVDHYMSLSYPMQLHEDEDGFTALYPDLPGCISYGDTPDDAVKRLKVTKRLWIEGKLESGSDIPLPSETPEFSGKFVLRIPRDLHRALHTEAAQEGVSLNQYVGHVLACRHNQSRVDLKEVVDNLRASIGLLLENPKKQYFRSMEKDFMLDAKKVDFSHIKCLPIPSGSFDYVVTNREFTRKAYSDEHPHLLWTECQR